MLSVMSLMEVIEELPHLTREERRLLCRRALPIDETDEVATLERSAAEGFALLDRMEAEDAMAPSGRGSS
jgi:hypothetical protein